MRTIALSRVSTGIAVSVICLSGMAGQKGMTMEAGKEKRDKPLVILLGDSIRMGYQAAAAATLQGKADVWAPKENCAHTVHTLAKIEEWLADKDPAVVHINCGLHDMWINEDGSIRHPLETYLSNVSAILEKIKACTPKATIIFALTTPVDQERQKTSGYGRIVRNNDDIPRYNAPTRTLVQQAGCRVDDLYGVVMETGKDQLIADDGVHFNAKGCDVLGKAVAECVLQALGE